jgi:hypothetical protein
MFKKKTQPKSQKKPLYEPPTVTTYNIHQLIRQLGPARASSCISCRDATDEEMIFGWDK